MNKRDVITHKSYVFDVQGLVQYPDFAREIIKPLERPDSFINFYTFTERSEAASILWENGLQRYIPSLFSPEDHTRFRETLRTALGLQNPLNKLGVTINPERSYKIMEEELERVYAVSSRHNIQRLFGVGGYWLRKYDQDGVNIKLPWIFGGDACMLVESDNIHPSQDDAFRINRSRYLYPHNKEMAEVCGYSLLYTVEYPGPWEVAWVDDLEYGVKEEGGTIYQRDEEPIINPFRLSKTPREVLTALKAKIFTWDGKQVTCALGDELHLYDEGRLSEEGMYKGPQKEF